LTIAASFGVEGGETKMKTLDKLNLAIVGCDQCSRLRSYCKEIARVKKREFKEWTYWGKPVPGFGDPDARLWIVGLAPAAHGANRTGRVFTGDSSGDWLFRALHHAGFANQTYSKKREDGLKLTGVYISSAARCAPPDNKPWPEEIARCSSFLDEEFRLLKNVCLFLALGAIGFASILKLLKRQGLDLPRPKPTFGHGKYFEMGRHGILVSYHPSRQNTNTGVLTETMWQDIFEEARKRLERRKA
jgi:uracil-DNA glycosylase